MGGYSRFIPQVVYLQVYTSGGLYPGLYPRLCSHGLLPWVYTPRAALYFPRFTVGQLLSDEGTVHILLSVVP